MGTQKVETYKGWKVYELHGYVWTDNNGGHMRRWTGDKGTVEHFDITVPNGDGFIMYIGKGTSTKCQSCQTPHSKNISSIWSRSSEYSLERETSTSEGEMNEIWWTIDEAVRLRPYETSDEVFYEPKWYVEYNEETNQALPKRFEYAISDGYAEYYETLQLSFTFEIPSAEESVRVEEFCKEIVRVGEDCGKLTSRDPSYFQGYLN